MTAKRGETVENDVLLATLAGLIHDAAKVSLWAGSDGSLAEQASAFVGEYGPQLVGQAQCNGLSNAVARMIEEHGDSTLTAPANVPLLCPVAARLQRIESGEDGKERRIGPAEEPWAYIPTDLVSADDGTSLDEGFLPREDLLTPSAEALPDLWSTLGARWTAFARDVGERRADGAPLTPHQLIHAVLGLLQRYLWGVPAYAEDGPADIPLLEHLRLTAACEAVKAARCGEEGKPYLLVIGDLSGIQDFIYGLQRRGLESQQHLAKRLRGRSFYLSALSRAIALWFAEECGVSEANIIASAGGNFQLLVPNTREAPARLEDGRKEMNAWLLRIFRGRLAAAIEWVEADAGDLQNPSAVAGGAYDRLRENKLHRFAELGVRGISQGLPREVLGECCSCGIALDGDNSRREKAGEGGEEIEVCVGCKDYGFVIGDVLPKAHYAAWHPGGDDVAGSESVLLCSEANQPAVLRFGPAGYAYLLSERPGEAIALGELVDCIEPAACGGLALPWWPVAHHVAWAKEAIDARDVFGGSDEATGTGAGEEQKLKERDVLPFDWLAGLSRGDKLLGVLRMDVDHMGDLAAASLPRAATETDHSTDQLARFMAFSRQVDWFFSGYVDHLCETEFGQARGRAGGRFSSKLPKIASKITGCFYVAYSGGDDLFVVGPWSEMVELTTRIEEAFGRCMCGNPAVGVSAGLLVSKPKVPIYMLARRGETLEHASKDGGRGRLTLFGTTVRWAAGEVSFEQARRLGEVLARAAAEEPGSGAPSSEGKSVPRAFLHLLLRLHERFGTGRHAGDKRYVPLLVWYLARTLTRVNPEVPRDDWEAVTSATAGSVHGNLRELLQATLITDPDRADAWMRRLRLPLSLALYLIRGEQRR